MCFYVFLLLPEDLEAKMVKKSVSQQKVDPELPLPAYLFLQLPHIPKQSVGLVSANCLLRWQLGNVSRVLSIQ